MTEVRGKLYVVRWYNGDEIATLDAFCPACDFTHSFAVDLVGHGKWETKPIWTFNGNWEKPTFAPSMLSNRDQSDEHHPRCHSFLIEGLWKYLNDSTHDMADQVVAVPDPNPDMSFKRRHGWHLYPWCDPVTGETVRGDDP